MPVTERKNLTQQAAYGQDSHRLVAACFLLVVAILLWSAHLRYQDFRAYHQAIANTATNELHNAIHRIIVERHRLVALFAEQHLALIRTTTRQPDSHAASEQLRQSIRRFFPDFFAYTLTDLDGAATLEDFDGFVGDLCLSDVRDFARTSVNPVNIHPNAFVYHFDIMTHWGENEGILLISFPTSTIADLLRTSQTPGHRLMVVRAGGDDLIEITADGDRIKLERDDFRLSDEERTLIIDRRPITNTKWDIVDLYSADFLPDYRRELLRETGLLIAALGMLSLLVLNILNRHERKRRSAERLKDEFVSVVSHELRTPLTSMFGALKLLNNGVCGALTPKANEILQICIRNTERLRVLVDDLLDMQKIEAGKLELVKQDIDVMSVVRDTLADNHDYAHIHGAELKLVAEVQDVMVRVDPMRISQAIANLLSNAAKFSPTGSVVEVSVTRPDKAWVDIAVEDDGPGISEAAQERLFEKFVQGDGSTTRKKGGTGLGLAIVKALVEAHGGTVGYTARATNGSRFSIRLPTV